MTAGTALTRAGARLPLLTAAWLLAVATVLAQVAYPLLDGRARDRLTVGTVVLFCAASLTHAAATRGPGVAVRVLVVSAGLGLAAEAVGVATGVPFGSYDYAGGLGPALLGVPVVIPLAWTMMAWPALLVGRRITSGRWRVPAAALALATWDVFLDPQMVRAGHWSFDQPGPALNGIPLVNHLGWVVVALVLMAVLDRVVPDPEHADDRLPVALYLWTYGASLLANLAFFDRPAVAVAGGLAMGVPVLLLLRALRARSSRAR